MDNIKEKLLSLKIHPFIISLRTFLKSPKKIVVSALFTIIALLVLTFVTNLIFFHRPIVIYGANTICYTNNLNNSYHTKDCGFLNNAPAEMLLWDAIESGYVDCPNCDANIYLSVPCYTTEHGECFHREKCQYIENSKANITIAFEAIKNNYRPCTSCFSLIDLNERCIVLPSGLYFHKIDNTIPRDYEQISHIKSLNQNNNVTTRIKETTVYKAIQRNYNPCSYCNVGMLDASSSYSNNYLASALISLSILAIVWTAIFVSYCKKCNK